MHAVFRADLASVKMLVQNKADPYLLDKESRSCLHIAAGNPDIGVIEFLVQIGCDVNLRTREGLTVLDLAIKNQNREIAQYLKEQ